MTDIEDIALIFGETNDLGSQRFISSLKLSVYESQDIYEERFPYSIAKTLTGDRYIWTVLFIEKLLYSFSSDDLANMNQMEYDIVIGLIDYQDRHSTIPSQEQIANGATGCTVLNELGISYVVYDGVISTDECIDAPNDVPRVSIYESLDTVLMNVLNCNDWQNSEILSGELEYVSQCNL